MEREYVRCLDRSDWLTLAFTAFSFHKLDSNIILRKSGPPKLFQPGRETRLQDCWWTKDHQVSFTLWCFYEILNGNLLWLKISIMYECPWSPFLERQSFHHYWRRDMTKKQNQCSTHSFTKQLRQWCFKWVEEGLQWQRCRVFHVSLMLSWSYVMKIKWQWICNFCLRWPQWGIDNGN